MDRWFILFWHYCRPVRLLLLASGLALSGQLLEPSSFHLLTFGCSFIGLVLFFFVQALMEEIRHNAKHRIAKRDSPLVRGLFSTIEFEAIIQQLISVMGLFTLGVWIFYSYLPALLYLLSIVYLWQSYKDFYIKSRLDSSPFFDRCTHLLVYLPLALFVYHIGRPDQLLHPQALSYAICIYGAFFTASIGADLDPHQHPIYNTFIHVYGFHKTFYFASATLILSALTAASFSAAYLLWPVEFAVFIAFCIVYLDSRRFKFAEQVAALSLMVHVFSGAILYFFRMAMR